MAPNQRYLVAMAVRCAVIVAMLLPPLWLLNACSWDNPVWAKSRFSDTPLFRFAVDDRAGYIDRYGRIVIQPLFSGWGNHGFDDYFEGVAAVELNRKRIFVDTTGKELKSHLLRYALWYSRFSEGLIVVWRGLRNDTHFGYGDHTGRVVIQPQYEVADNFSEGLAAVRKNRLYGYIDHTGRTVITHRYLLAEPFVEGAARVVVDGPCVHFGYAPCAAANPSVLPARTGTSLDQRHCLYSFIDRQGNLLFQSKFPDAFDFSERLAAVGDGRHWGFVDKSGAVRIPLQFDEVGSFSDGLARVRKGNVWGFINHSGAFTIPPEFESASDFSEGLAAVGRPYKQLWYINTRGQRAIPFEFDAASDFRMGLAHVRRGDHACYIDRGGRVVFSYDRTSKR